MNQWYQMAVQANTGVAEFQIIDFIGGWADDLFGLGVTARAFVNQLNELPDGVQVIKVRINSPGGDVFGALNIANALRAERAKGRRIETVVDGMAASAASVILMAGDKITVSDNALVMIHNPFTMKAGNADEMRRTADTLDALRDALVTTYQWHSKLDAKVIKKLMDEETWMDADQAIALGFATHKAEGLRAAASLTPAQVAHLRVPEAFAGRVAALVAAAPPFPPKKKADPEAPAAAPPEPGAPEEPKGPPEPPEPGETPAEAPVPAEEPAPEPKKTTTVEDLKALAKDLADLAKGLAEGTVAFDEKAQAALVEQTELLGEALEALPPIPEPMEEKKPKAEPAEPVAPAEPDAAPAGAPGAAPEPEKPKAALEGALASQARVENVTSGAAPAALPLTEVLALVAAAGADVAFAQAQVGRTRAEVEQALAAWQEARAGEETRCNTIRAMYKAHNLGAIGEVVARGGMNVQDAGVLVTDIKALLDPVEIDTGLGPDGGQRPRRRTLSYRDTYARINNPLAFKKE